MASKQKRYPVTIYAQDEKPEASATLAIKVSPQEAWEHPLAPQGPPTGPTLESIIAETRPLPPYSVLVGACEDGYHFFLDLSDPRPGSLLISGNLHSSQRMLLNAILTSASLLNPPSRVRYSLVTPYPQNWENLEAHPNADIIAAPYARESNTLVNKLSELVEGRRSGRLRGPAYILGIENLTYFTERMDREVAIFFNWLIQEGPKSRVWTIATSDIKDTTKIQDNLMRAFGMQLIETERSRHDLPPRKPDPGSNGGPRPFQPYFKVYLHDEGWVRFLVPRVE
jgi:hypothetical protein